jgi:peptidyl-prolyl cis-trans isomerase D
VKLISVTNQLGDDEESKESAKTDFESALAAEYVSGYAASLKAKEDIQVNTGVLFSKSE